MNEDRSSTRHRFLSRMFSGNAEDEGTTVYSTEEVGVTEEETVEPRGFTIERAAEVIRSLPPEVPHSSAVRIVRGTLEAAGIDIADLASSTRARESKLASEIELSQGRIQKLKNSAEEVIRNYELEIRRAREARDSGISEEERKISEARDGLDDVERVRDFFALSEADHATTGELPGDDDTQVMERPDEDDTEILRRPGPLSEGYLDENRDR